MKRLCLVATALLCLLGWSISAAEPKPIRVLVWDEQQPEQKQAYGDKFLGETIAAHLRTQSGFIVKTANLESPEQGVDEATLDNTDVLIWWAHRKSTLFTDEHAERVASRVRAGKLQLIALHSSHWAKPFVKLMQDRAKADALAQVPAAERASAKWEYLNESPIYKMLRKDAPLTPAVTRGEGNTSKLTLPACVFPTYRNDGAPSHVTTLLPKHPIAAGLPEKWDVPHTEMYGEPFHVPKPDEVIFEERWDKGEQFRSGCVWQVGQGRVFYFRPGHETYAIYQQAEPLRVIVNAIRWLGSPIRQ